MTDRYVTAVLSGVPARERPAVEGKLRDAIGNSVSRRVADGQDRSDAERTVLSEMGDPMRVSASYTGRGLHLIGPELYPAYIRLLRLLLSIVVPIVAVVVGAATAIAGAEFGEIVAAGIGTAFTVGVQVAFWVTLAFALVDRYGSRPLAEASTWDVDDLPEPPSPGVSLGGTIASVVGLAVLCWLLIWQPGYQESFDPGGPSIPVLDPTLADAWIPYLIAILLASMALEIVTYLKGRWTVPLAVVNTVLNLAFTIPVVWLATTDRLLNPAFVAAIAVDGVDLAVDGMSTLIAWIVVVVSVIDIGGGWWKALRSSDPLRRGSRAGTYS